MWVFSSELEGCVRKSEAEAMLDTMQEVADSTATRYKLIIADMLYAARRLPAGDYRRLLELARRGGVEGAENPLDAARSPEQATT